MNESIKRYLPTEKNFKEWKERGHSVVKFQEYNTEIDRVRNGEEDFSDVRWHNWTITRQLYLPTGRKRKSGKPRWEYEGPIVCGGDARRCKKIAQLMHGTQVSVRKY